MRLSIRTKFFLATASVSVLFVVTVVTPASHYVRGIIRNEVTASLRTGHLAFQRFLQLRQDVLLRRARSIAETPYVKATVSIPDVDRETVIYALRQIGELGDGDFVLATDEEGALLGQLGDARISLTDVASVRSIDAALAGEEHVALWSGRGDAFHVALSPIVSGERVAGIIALGTRVDAAFAHDVKEFSGGDVIVLNDDVVVASSSPTADATNQASAGMEPSELPALARIDTGSAPEVLEVSVAGRPCLAMVASILGTTCRVVLLRHLDEMDESLRVVRNGIIAAGLGAVLLAIGVSFWVAGRVSGPIRRLRNTVRRFGPDNLGLRVQVKSRDELGELGASFNRMAERLADNAEELRYLAYFDPLTNLRNGAGFKEHLAGAIARADRSGGSVAVLFLDLHRFKRVNDTLGHDQGDALLKLVADRLTECVDQLDDVAGGSPPPARVLSRMGGDHFMLLLEAFGDVGELADFARKLNERCSMPVVLGTHEIGVQTSVGISVFPIDGTDVPTLLKNADTAKQHAKMHSGLPVQFYSRALTVQAAEFMSMESDLRHAVARDQLRLFAQPQIEIRTGRVCGAEMLLRWDHPKRGLVSPGDFVPLAEVTGLIVPIGEWVIRESCRVARTWQGLLEEPIRVGINISGVQFRPDLVDIMRTTIADFDLPPELVDLEITETVVMRTAEATISTLDQLKAMGVTLSIDDFGTGYSSLSYLKRFPIDTLKIDGAFIRDVTERPEDAAITRAIIAMGHSLGFKVIAEGVETAAHLAFLEAAGCDEAQGYLFARPVPVLELPDLVRELSRRRA